MSKRVFIIAEAGVNHNGSIDNALKLVDIAAEAGADAVKFQTFRATELATATADKANYQKVTTGSQESQLEMLKKLELGEEHHRKLMEHCTRRKIQFLSTAFDLPSVDFLHSLNLPIWKVPSGEITNVPYLRAIAATGKPVILSTGMATLSDVEFALHKFYGAGYSKEKITLLHCTTEYPASMQDLNLRAMQTMQTAFGTPVGYSDHSPGIEVSIAAVALGATLIEKHFTIDKGMSGPDHSASLAPEELIALVASIRNIERALGNGVKVPSAKELENLPIVRKGIHASKAIRVGDTFGSDNLTCKRPVNGLPASMWDFVIGRKAPRDYESEEAVDL
ncbi:MAG: N-acetylneuraminate synthase [Leptospiraceae bacterium]|nr:N-acetylneuraminate synthase [Leptospiraceae bacterium]